MTVPAAEKLNLTAEAVLDSAIQFNHPLSKNLNEPKAIFLTGSTGFLGAYLLAELLKTTTADIYCLLRCRDAKSGKQRLTNHLQFYSLWQEKFAERLIPVIGDLSQPLLGLKEDKFNQLAAQIEIIYHNGAQVNSVCPYSTLKPTNVLGTQEVLRLASLSKTKPVHFVSTLAVFFSQAYAEKKEVRETDIPDLATLKGGYKQSKCVAEELIRIAQKRGLPASIYRPVRILGDSQTGINGNFNDFLCSFLKGCIQLGKYPKLTGTTNIVPVDYVSQAIATLSQQETSYGKAFHILNPEPTPWENLFEKLRSLGYHLEALDYDQWLSELEKQATQQPENELYSFLLLMTSSPALLAKKPHFTHDNTQQGLTNTSITCPQVNQQLITTYINYFQKSDYLPTPQPKTKKVSAFWKSIKSNVKRQQQAETIKPVPRNQNLPLSFGQERLWYIEQLHPGNPVHNLRAVYRIQGLLDISILEKSIQEIIRRHEILRTTFPTIDGKPVQVISPEINFQLPIISLEELTTEQKEAEIRNFATKEAQQPFDISTGPLLRIKLLQLSQEEYVLVRTIHHIINDVWSDTVFMRELVTLYKAFSSEKPSPLPQLPIQYADFAAFQRQWLQGKVLQSQLNYWKQHLSSNLTGVNLPTDYSPTTIPSYQGAAQYLIVPQELTAALKSFSHQQGVSLFVTLLTAYKTLLYQYSGQKDIIVCSPVAGRHRLETKKLLGYFSNILLLHTNFENNPSLRELISRVSQVSLGAQEHQDLPFQQLVEALGVPSAILSRTMFTMQNAPSQPREIGGMSLSFVDVEEGIANFDLSLSVKETGETLTGIMRYKTDLFAESTITQILENFQALLTKLVANPDLHLLDLPLFVEANSAEPSPQLVETTYVAPEKEIERTIAKIWQDVLQIDKIGIHANFFDIGGRSLAMIRVYHQLKEVFPCDIAVVNLFKYPTISGMASYLSQELADANDKIHEKVSSAIAQKEV
ncbi:thioester reductase domain-containing protein [Oscillatoria salina]|uniref:thioester reductase domain-containing protein n=1 Tax=Oscillatoria salina TaxID=331517 RepID=UPI001CCABF07|nr:thioester reductase domain-containing protein [Oscillatoria salina]MBZ8182539.1 NAD-dependent epimerase/dehydratase family protein [Oscillatoria salina IIICB1]